MDAPDPDATVCLLRAIQDRLDVMPETTKEFYGSLIVGLASEAEKDDGLGNGSSPNAWATASADRVKETEQ